MESRTQSFRIHRTPREAKLSLGSLWDYPGPRVPQEALLRRCGSLVCLCSVSRPSCRVTLLFWQACPRSREHGACWEVRLPGCWVPALALWLRYLGHVTYPGVLFCKVELALMLTLLMFPANETTCKAAQITEDAVDHDLREWVP